MNLLPFNNCGMICVDLLHKEVTLTKCTHWTVNEGIKNYQEGSRNPTGTEYFACTVNFTICLWLAA